MADARRRFVRLMKLMFAASLLVTAGAFIWFRLTGVPTPWPFVAAVAFAVFGSLMLAAALMGLIFFSAASGADEEADRRD
jgi:FtsH-binding integral membrane protein